MAAALHNLEEAMYSSLRFSFFITKDMKVDLQSQQLNGTLPIFYVFLARADKNITDVTFIDSTAIGVLAGVVEKLDETGGGSLSVVCTHEKVMQIFEITGLDSVISVHPSREDALAALAPAG